MRQNLSRRDLLKAGGGAVAAAAVGPHLGLHGAYGQTPKRGGTLSLRLWDPPHFDPHMTISYKTNILYTFTHSRLLKYKAGPGVQPGTFTLEGDLAESWSQPNETTYIFKLRKGVRWHAKPPVNGRELTADDVKYTFERFVNEKGNAYRNMLAALDKVEVVDKYTVKFTFKEPYVWFLDTVANPAILAIVARECVEKFGDLKKAEAMIGTGPWMLDGYRPNVGLTLVRNPSYFVAGLPYIDRVEVTVDEDNASRMAAFVAGKYDLGMEASGTIDRVDWMQIKDTIKQRRPRIQTLEFPNNQMSHVYMRTDKPPFNDVRVRRAISLAFDRKGILDATYEGVGVLNPAVPTALKDWAIPIDRLGEGAQYYKHDPAQAKKLLAEAGFPNGFQATVSYTTYGWNILVDQVQLLLKYLKDIGIDAKVIQQEYGAYIATTVQGKFESMAYGPQTPFLDPDNFLYGPYMPGEAKNQGHVNDPVLSDMLVRQRRTADTAKRREIIYDIQRHAATQQYYVYAPSSIAIAVWDGAVKNYGPNLGYDWGGRVLAAWLDR
jgi:peptide/nickel transport system substrate-binding protein